jgi:hypothetical protein
MQITTVQIILEFNHQADFVPFDSTSIHLSSYLVHQSSTTLQFTFAIDSKVAAYFKNMGTIPLNLLHIKALLKLYLRSQNILSSKNHWLEIYNKKIKNFGNFILQPKIAKVLEGKFCQIHS